MTRTRAEALTLVNWKGVFYRRYALDPQVTALEGANGAGKTTVMIAAYVVLMPDLTRLRFANIGEGVASGGDKGIYGRLGHPDAPSYATIEYRLAKGERLLAGVRIERRAEPNVELTPFVIRDLAHDVAVQNLLLDRGDRDEVPSLDRIHELVTRAGGHLRSYSKPADYFVELFDRGVNPLRLVGDDERTNFNEMLRTSMIGGISKSLTGGLREFLLKAETGLADTLKQMRSNLDECRRTRAMVEDARRMEQEIQDVYDAGHRMFAMAVHATRERAEEAEEALRNAQHDLDNSEELSRGLASALEKAQTFHDGTKRSLREISDTYEEARTIVETIRIANAILRRLETAERERAPRAEELAALQEETRRATEARARAEEQRGQRQEGLEQAARGLADFQVGLDAFHRRASAFEQATHRFGVVQRALPDREVHSDNIDEVFELVADQITALDAQAVRLEREVATAARRRREHAAVLDAVAMLTGAPVSAADALETARTQLGRVRRLQDLATEVAGLPERVSRERALASRQSTTRNLAARWSTPESTISTAAEGRAAYATEEAQIDDLRDSMARLAEERTQNAHLLADATKAVANLSAELVRWQDLRARIERFERACEVTLANPDDLASLQKEFIARRDRQRDDALRLEGEERRLRGQADDLEHRGGQFSDLLLRARDAVDGELLAARYEDVPVQQAGALQARLGPLADAILVEDVSRAAQTLAIEPQRPSTIFLVDDSMAAFSDTEYDPSERVGDAILVRTSVSLRVSTIPPEPTLGRRARLQRVRALREEADKAAGTLDEVVREVQQIETRLADLSTFLSDVTLLWRPDPSGELKQAQVLVLQRESIARKQAAAHDALEAQLQLAVERRQGLRALLVDIDLLDSPDHAAETARLEAHLRDARLAVSTLRRLAGAIAIVEQQLDVLRVVPPDEAEVSRMAGVLASRRDERDGLAPVREALSALRTTMVALTWTDAPAALRSQLELRPALDAQLESARGDCERASENLRKAERALERAHTQEREVRAQLEALDATLARDRGELKATGVEDASDEALAEAVEIRNQLRDRHGVLDESEREAGRAVEIARFKDDEQKKVVVRLRRIRDEEEARCRPVADRWQRLQSEAEQARVLRTALTPAIFEETRSAGSVRLYQRAENEATKLQERLSRSHDGKECATKISELLKHSPRDFGPTYLKAWLEAREWLRRRVPPQIAEVDEPLEMLARVAEHLSRLSERLADNERKLRGRSEDVARNIETQRRKARQAVLKLNDELRRVRFGSIHGVQIQVRAMEKLEGILHALREGHAEQTLFNSAIPLEEALEQLFKQHGGRDRSGYQLLDYREYMDLQVEIRRQVNPAWEPANPTRMSTGEAIGVGAAIMMVVLTAWEHHANLLRSRRAAGTLRFLFLDEANRLSQDNLAVLFELCQNLELQLLIAAPEVAQAQGNTTYRLVRQVDAHGEEVVLVTGRRSQVAQS